MTDKGECRDPDNLCLNNFKSVADSVGVKGASIINCI